MLHETTRRRESLLKAKENPLPSIPLVLPTAGMALRAVRLGELSTFYSTLTCVFDLTPPDVLEKRPCLEHVLARILTNCRRARQPGYDLSASLGDVCHDLAIVVPLRIR